MERKPEVFTPGDACFYSDGGNLCEGIYCCPNMDGKYVVFPLAPKHFITSDGKGHEWYSCHEVHVDELFHKAEDVIAYVVKRYEQNWRLQLNKLPSHRPGGR